MLFIAKSFKVRQSTQTFISKLCSCITVSPELAMLDLLRGLKSLVKLSHVQIDSSIFRLHYTITVMACLAFSLLVTARQYVGNPIDCVHTKDIPEVRKTFCIV